MKTPHRTDGFTLVEVLVAATIVVVRSRKSRRRQLRRAMETLTETLYQLQPATDENGQPKPSVVGLSSAGKRAWVTFYNEHASRLVEATGAEAALLAKIEGAGARSGL